MSHPRCEGSNLGSQPAGPHLRFVRFHLRRPKPRSEDSGLLVKARNTPRLGRFTTKIRKAHDRRPKRPRPRWASPAPPIGLGRRPAKKRIPKLSKLGPSSPAPLFAVVPKPGSPPPTEAQGRRFPPLPERDLRAKCSPAGEPDGPRLRPNSPWPSLRRPAPRYAADARSPRPPAPRTGYR